MDWNLLYILDAVAVALFALSYYRQCYRKGFRIDLWHTSLFLGIVFPLMLLLPFARNELNAVIVGKDNLPGIIDATPTVFLIGMAGYWAMLTGGALWRVRTGLGLRSLAARLLERGPQCSMMLMSSRQLLVFMASLFLSAQALILGVYFAHEGFGFNLRAYAFANPSIRPFSQFASLGSVIVASHCFARYIDTRERVLLACTMLLTLGLLFFGQRGNIVVVFINVGLCCLMKLRRRLRLLPFLAMVLGAAAFVLYLGSLRSGQYSIGDFLASFAFLVLYGENFCELRDFAWIYSKWNHEFWIGKTYLAGLATFVPRGLSQFREVWSFGVATDWTVGLDTDLHPGLKPGQFGEAFFNFGVAGVIVVGLINGILVRRADMDLKANLSSSSPSIMRAFSYTMLINVAACFNVSLAVPFFYALLGVYMVAWFYLRLRTLLLPRRALLPVRP